jgi:RNA polymerase sigma-70 factor, ECF subfamily
MKVRVRVVIPGWRRAARRPYSAGKTGRARRANPFVATVLSPMRDAVAAPMPASDALDPESADWVRALSGPGPDREPALSRLYALLLRAARFEVRRRARGRDWAELDDLATQAADDALMAVMAKLPTYRGDSRFTTWAYKFALLEAGVKLRRRAWQDREVPLEAEGWARLRDRRPAPPADVETAEVLGAVRAAIADALTPHQRTVLIALALNDVPIDVLAERLDTTRGALYKTLHDARRKLRVRLEEDGLR